MKTRPLYLPLFLLLGMFLYSPAALTRAVPEDPQPGLSASLDRESVKVGGILRLSLDIRLPEGSRLPDDPKIGGLDDLNIIDRQAGPEKIVFTVLVDRIGSWKTGPLSLTYLDRAGKEKTLTSPPVSVDVLSNLGEKPEEAGLKPIQDIIPITALWLRYIPWIAGALALLAAGFGLFVWYRRRRRRGDAFQAQDPPHIRALKAIQELESEKLFEKGDVKAFYFRLSEILRHYLESLRGFPAAECTTEEIASYVDNEQDRDLLPLLRRADLVKFADRVPTQAGKEDEIRSALSYIQGTGPSLHDLESSDSHGSAGK